MLSLTDQKGLHLQVLSATATQLESDWTLKLHTETPEQFNSAAFFNDYVDKIDLANDTECKQTKQAKDKLELVLFIGVHATRDDFLVVGEDAVPERTLFDSLFRLAEPDERAGMVRRVFVFTVDNCEKPGTTGDPPTHSAFDPAIMKGVTLYRLQGQSGAGIPVDEIKAAAGISRFSDPDKSKKRKRNESGKQKAKPESAMEFYRRLNTQLSGHAATFRIAVVPNGNENAVKLSAKSCSEKKKKDYVLLLVNGYHPDYKDATKDVEADCNCVKGIVGCLKNTECLTPNRINFEEGCSKQTVIKWMNERARDLAEFKDTGRIWLFVSAHGNESGGIMLSKGQNISLDELTEPLFSDDLKDITKVLILNCCRGKWPLKDRAQAQQADSSCETKYGLMFRNQAGEDPWSMSGRQRCVTLFGSVPGFACYRPPRDGRNNYLFKAIRKAAKELKLLKLPEELHDFVQRIQRSANAQFSGASRKRHGIGSVEEQPECLETAPSGQQDSQAEGEVCTMVATISLEQRDDESSVTGATDVSMSECGDTFQVAAGIVARKRRTSEVLEDPDRLERPPRETDQLQAVTRLSNADQEVVVPK